MRTVLLIDDDAAILDGLRKALRSHRDWAVDTATDGGTALRLLAQRAFDVVVSDALMPGIDGEALLSQVRTQWPTTLRVILSGQVEHASAERWSAFAHQFIPKPVKPATLYMLIEEALKSRERLSNPSLRALVGQLGTLPSLPTVFTALTALTSSPKYTLDDVVELVQRDPGISADVLKLVNSVWFGLPSPVSSLREAVRVIGINPLRTLVLSAGVFSGTSELCQQLMHEAMARHSYIRRLAQARPLAGPLLDVALTASVVCDVARLLLPQHRQDEVVRCEALVASGQRRCTAEHACFGADHALIGAVLLGEWGLPSSVVDAVATHHSPQLHGAAACAVGLASVVIEAPRDPGDIASMALPFGLTVEEAQSLRPGEA